MVSASRFADSFPEIYVESDGVLGCTTDAMAFSSPLLIYTCKHYVLYV